MRIEVKCQPVCGYCEGKGTVIWGTSPKPKECITCNGKGYADEVMEMKWMGHTYNYRPTDEGEIKSYNLGFEPDGSLFICTFDKDGKYIANVSKSLNIQSLHIIEEKECPECEGTEEIPYPYPHGFKNDFRKCENCKNGKIEVETSFTIFDKSQEEYDTEIRSKIITTALFKNLEPVFYEYSNLKIKQDEAMKLFKDIIIGTEQENK